MAARFFLNQRKTFDLIIVLRKNFKWENNFHPKVFSPHDIYPLVAYIDKYSFLKKSYIYYAVYEVC